MTSSLRISNRREIRDPLLVIRFKSVGNLGVALQTLLAGVAGKILSANVGLRPLPSYKKKRETEHAFAPAYSEDFRKHT